MSAAFETSFANALLDADQPIPGGVIAHNAEVPTRRFAVYRNNVVVGLAKAIRNRFPVVEKIVGEEFFAAMARIFVTEQPPRSPLLATYGDEFADFITAFEPVRELAYLADVARLEAARTRAYHAADAKPLDVSRLARLDPATVERVLIDLHPSIGIVRSPYPIVTIWAMNSGELPLAPIEHWRGEDALIARPYLEVEVRALPPGGAVFLFALAAGQSLAGASGMAHADDPNFDLTGNVAGLFGSGLASAIAIPESKGDRLP